MEMGIAAMMESRPLFWIHIWSVPLLLITGITLIHLFGIFGVPVSGVVIGGVLLVLTVRAFRRVAAGEGPGRAAPAEQPRHGELLVTDPI
jgi:hypothetical protein